MLFNDKTVVCRESNTEYSVQAKCRACGCRSRQYSTHTYGNHLLNIFLSAHIASYAFFSYFTMNTLHNLSRVHVYSMWISRNKIWPITFVCRITLTNSAEAYSKISMRYRSVPFYLFNTPPFLYLTPLIRHSGESSLYPKFHFCFQNSLPLGPPLTQLNTLHICIS